MQVITREAILKAPIAGDIAKLMVETSGDQVFLTEDVTVSAKIAEMVTAINQKAKAEEVDRIYAELSAILNNKADGTETAAAIASKADKSVVETLSASVELKADKSELETSINNLRQEIMGDAPAEAVDTFTELAGYIAEHEDVSEALTAAIGQKADLAEMEALHEEMNAVIATKADKSEVETVQSNIDTVSESVALKADKSEVTSSIDTLTASVELKADKSEVETVKSGLDALGSLASKDIVEETDLADNVREKILASSEGNHGHVNKDILDGITEDMFNNVQNLGDMAFVDSVAEENLALMLQTKVNTATHENRDVLDGITADKVASWDGKTKFHLGTTELSDDTEGYLWFQITS